MDEVRRNVNDGQRSEESESERDDPEIMLPKRAKFNWQETLIALVSTQQQQLAELTRSAKMAAEPTPVLNVVEDSSAHASTSASTSFRLADFDPDHSSYSIEEWLDDATKLKIELNISDMVMIVKVGEALKNRAYQYYCDWRPISRTWANFSNDLIAAFPDPETPGARAFTAATLRSQDCDSLSDYGIQKLRSIHRFHDGIPWNKILSMVEYGLDHAEAQASVRIQKPASERELLKLLGEFDARRRKHRLHSRLATHHAAINTTAHHRRSRTHTSSGTFKGVCFKCGQLGHRQDVCKTEIIPKKTKRPSVTPIKTESTLPNCNHCKRIGHTEEKCWFKHGKPKILLIRRGRDLATSPMATLLCENKVASFTYIIDSGADSSILSDTAAKRLGVVIKPGVRALQGIGSQTILAIGTCEVIAVLPNVTLEIVFTVVSSDVIPGNLDAIIGWDVISRKNLRIEKGVSALELHYDLSNASQMLTVRNDDDIQLNVSGLDEDLLMKLRELVTLNKKKTPDHITTGKLTIQLKDNIPVAYRPRRLAYAERVQVQRIVKELLEANIIRESHSAYASPIVLVKKKTGDFRLCVDYRDINKKAIKERYPLPLICDQIDALCHAKFFTKLDMKSGFHQMEIEESSKHITAFITPDGHYEYNRVPFGFVNSPSVYQRAIDKALGCLKGKEAYVYMDDVLIPSKTIEEGFAFLQNVLNALAVAGFSLNYKKCRFFDEETEYLGVVLSKGTVRPSPKKVHALKMAAPPSDVKGVRQFMGLAGYFRRFIENFSIITAPISELLRKNQPFQWTPNRENIRQLIITKLVSPPILRMFDPNLKSELHTDASALGIAGVLMQNENGTVHPVAYYSRRTTDCESRYHSYDLETLALVDSIEHFRYYLYGVPFTVYTDCSSVRATAMKKHLHPRVARWWIKLQDYDFNIEYRPGHKMKHVDYLSRNPVEVVCALKTVEVPSDINCDRTLIEYQQCDEFCNEVKQNPDNYANLTVINDVVVTRDIVPRCYVPVAARLETMRLYHDKSSHIGFDKCLAKLREDLFWPKMGKCLKKFIKNCRACVLGKSHTGRKSGMWQDGDKPEDILETWHIDHAGPLVKSQGCTQILVVIDAFSKYCKLLPIGRKTTEDTIAALWPVFVELGKPRRIVADRAAAFTSGMFRNFLKDQDIDLHHIATGMPRGNGQVERMMRTVFNLLRATLTADTEKEWVATLSEIENNVNGTIHRTTGFTPNVLHLGTNPRLSATENLLKGIPTIDQYIDPEEAVVKARIRMKQDATTQAKKFNLTRYATELFTVGDKVAIEDTQVASGGKLKPKFKGPYAVRTILPNERYVLSRKGAKLTVAAHEQLRRWPATTV